jgi:hypothetical protein
MDRLEHAQGLVRYYEARIRMNDGFPEWREVGLQTAKRYLRLARASQIQRRELEHFLAYLLENSTNHGGSAWMDMIISVEAWIKSL